MFKPRRMHPLGKPCSAVPGVENCILMLGPVFKEKRSNESTMHTCVLLLPKTPLAHVLIVSP